MGFSLHRPHRRPRLKVKVTGEGDPAGSLRMLGEAAACLALDVSKSCSRRLLDALHLPPRRGHCVRGLRHAAVKFELIEGKWCNRASGQCKPQYGLPT